MFRDNIDTLVCEIGDKVQELSGSITAISISDPVNSGNQIAFSVTTSAGLKAIVRADSFVPILAVAPESQGNQALPPLASSEIAGGGWQTDPYAGGGDIPEGQPHAGDPYTIGNNGCNLTVLSMALNYVGITTDPRSLNDLLTSAGSAFGGTNVHSLLLGTDTAIAAKAAAASGLPNHIVFHPYTTSDPDVLEALLRNSRSPVIVAVQPTVDGAGHPIWGHFVLVTGIQGNVFTINDPGDSQNTRLDPADEEFQTRGYVVDPVDQSEMEISAAGAGDGLLVTVEDAQGRITGFDPSSGQEVSQIPGSASYIDGLEGDASGSDHVESNSVIELPTPAAGQYTVTITGGAATEPYTLAVGNVAADGSIQPAVFKSGTTTAGSSSSFQYTFSSSSQLPAISISDVTKPEGSAGTTAFDFTVSLSAQPTQAVTLNYTTADNTATLAGGDYQAASGGLTFTPGGALSQTIHVTVNGDMSNEPDETFFVNLTNIVNAALNKNVGVGTVLNDDTPISISSVSEYEGNSGTTPFAFTIRLGSASSLPVSVDYATADGTATEANNDYQAHAGTVTFAPGQTSQTITINVTGDQKAETDETFFVNLVNPMNGALATGAQQGVGTVLDDDSNGTNYYVNDASTVGDVYCTAAGNNANDGKTPASPVASLTGLLSLYTFHPADTIYVDTGAYELVRNVVLGPGFTGVRIIGPGARTVTPSLDGSTVLADGPVAFWRLGDASSTVAADSSGHGHAGTYSSGVATNSQGPSLDGAASFDGNGGHIEVPYASSLDSTPLTIEAWVKYEGRPGDLGQSVLTIGDYYLTYWSGTILFEANQAAYPVGAPLAVGKWTYVVATIDANNSLELYINGKLASGPNLGVPYSSTGQPLEIGTSTRSGQPSWKGDIDELAIYNKVLTPAQIQTHYAAAVSTGAVIDRSNTSAGSYVIELAGAANVVLSGLSFTGKRRHIRRWRRGQPRADRAGRRVFRQRHGNRPGGLEQQRGDRRFDHPRLGPERYRHLCDGQRRAHHR